MLQKKKAEQEKLLIQEIKDTEEGQELLQKLKWNKALLKAQGEKIKDDPALLKKVLKRKQKKKQKSAKSWEERKKKQQDDQKMRQKRRSENIREKIEARKDKKMGKKVRRLVECQKEPFLSHCKKKKKL